MNMIKKIVLISVLFIGENMLSYGAESPFIPKTPTTVSKKEQAAAKDKELLVVLYAEPKKNAAMLKRLPVNADFVGIYYQNGWMKVGDRADGATGWINLDQYKSAKQNFYQHYFSDKIDSVYLRKTKDKDGKMIVEGYKDGKKLSDTEAKKLYIDLQERERRQWEAIQRFNQLMDEQMRQDYLNARRALDEAFEPPMSSEDGAFSSGRSRK